MLWHCSSNINIILSNVPLDIEIQLFHVRNVKNEQVWKRKKALLTWPKKRKGNRKVSPLHIQDWNPSAQKQKSCNSDLETTWHRILHEQLTAVSANNLTLEKQIHRSLNSSYPWHLCPSTLMLTTISISHLYPIFSSDMLLQMAREFKWLRWLPPKIAYNSPTVRSSWFLSPKARSLYKQPLW